MNALRAGLGIVAAWLFATPLWAAPAIEELQRLSYGMAAVKHNNPSSSLTLSPQGIAAYGDAFVYIAPTRPGRYRVTGLPPFTDLNISIAPIELSRSGTGLGPFLTLDTAVSHPLVPRTDAAGTVEFYLGARLTTSGSGVPYPDGLYRARPALRLDFFADTLPTHALFDIDVEVELRSVLELAELDRLDFGRFVAIASAADQAAVTLTPSGLLAAEQPGQARLLNLGGASPGRYRVFGGAANAPVQLTLPTEPIHLVHASQSSAVARFVLDQFTVLPPLSSLQLDANGTLEFRLGARLRTELTAKPYLDGEYTGIFSLNVEYP